jgi:anaerobic selenocysteine-containing dehydrogenase
VITTDEYDESWRRLRRERIQLHIPELLDAVAALPERPVPGNDPQYPYVLSAGERRAFTANTIIRDPEWRRRDPDGRLRMSNTDAERLGITSGDHIRLTTRTGSADVQVDVTDTMRAGHLALPNGLGLTVDDPAGDPVTTGVATNTLTDHRDRDEWAGTPWHKHVPASIDIISKPVSP